MKVYLTKPTKNIWCLTGDLTGETEPLKFAQMKLQKNIEIKINNDKQQVLISPGHFYHFID